MRIRMTIKKVDPLLEIRRNAARIPHFTKPQWSSQNKKRKKNKLSNKS